jgi:DNA-binding transcriptional ArsR family regulator
MSKKLYSIVADLFDVRQEGGTMFFMPKPLPVLEDTSPICCAPLGSAPLLDRADAVALAVRLKALADPVRLQLVAHLLAAPNWEACTCDLIPVVELSGPTINHHLKQLVDTGLCTKRREGMNVYYRLVPEAVTAIARTLDRGCC